MNIKISLREYGLVAAVVVAINTNDAVEMTRRAMVRLIQPISLFR